MMQAEDHMDVRAKGLDLLAGKRMKLMAVALAVAIDGVWCLSMHVSVSESALNSCAGPC